jgi:hypothetical protein
MDDKYSIVRPGVAVLILAQAIRFPKRCHSPSKMALGPYPGFEPLVASGTGTGAEPITGAAAHIKF